MIETQDIRARSDVPVEFTWDLAVVFENEAAWERELAEMEAMKPALAALQGTVVESATTLLHALEVTEQAEMKMQRVYLYARMRKDTNGTDAEAQALDSRSATLYSQIGAAVSFLEPEILTIPPDTLAEWESNEPRLKPYAYYLDHLMRMRAHVRSAEVEEILAEFGDVTRAPSDTYEALTNIDLAFPSIEDDHGQPVQLSSARYLYCMRSADRRLRHDAFKAFFNTYGSVKTTLSTTLGATVRDHALTARLRKYPSALAASLEPNDIPIEVYGTLISTIHSNLPLLHRYMTVRKRLLGLDELHPYDLYAPLVPDVDDTFEYETGKRMVREAFTPLGREYAAALEQVLDRRWIDVYENVGKQSGAYSGGGYTTPPFILLNYQDRLADVATLAHELGHSLHSY
ncbi:MAG TPA: M3 family oligoendopeptidase, partial [Chloroflexota bacterium]